MVSIVEVAELAGVSVATVSRALQRPEKVAEATRKRVLQAVEKTGYVTNVMASNFRRRRSDTIVVLVPDIANPFYSTVIQEIELVASKQGYRILLGETRQDEATEHSYGDLAVQKMADGIISLGMHIPFKCSPNRKTIDTKWPPLVMACEYQGSIPVPTIAIDNRRAAFDATNHLIGLGHQDIAYMSGPLDFSLCRDREEGFREAMSKAGLKVGPGRVVNGDFSLESGKIVATELLTSTSRPSALFCTSDEQAMGAMAAARELGMDIPGDVSIAGFDDIPFADYTHPPLTTVRQPMAELGRKAMETLLAILQGRPVPAERTLLSHQLIVRASTAAPPAK